MISLGEGFLLVSRIRHSSGRRKPNADQFVVDAVLEGGGALELFLAHQELDPSKPYWTAEYSQQRVAAITALLQTDPHAFVIGVTPTADGQFDVVDGNHRLRIARIRGLTEVKVIFFLNIPSIDWKAPRQIFLDRLIDRPRNQPAPQIIEPASQG